jgi:excisionase family DNA binding protein
MNKETLPIEPLQISVREASKILGISQRTLWNIVKTGDIAVNRIGHRVLFPLQELRRYVNEKTRCDTNRS